MAGLVYHVYEGCKRICSLAQGLVCPSYFRRIATLIVHPKTLGGESARPIYDSRIRVDYETGLKSTSLYIHQRIFECCDDNYQPPYIYYLPAACPEGYRPPSPPHFNPSNPLPEFLPAESPDGYQPYPPHFYPSTPFPSSYTTYLPYPYKGYDLSGTMPPYSEVGDKEGWYDRTPREKTLADCRKQLEYYFDPNPNKKWPFGPRKAGPEDYPSLRRAEALKRGEGGSTSS
ncbi:uncharacterized protein LOC113360849 [Papaver somniferum]|uniref:uncharacterized protein LOC113360849 n=1 Tax=Papaver somniferum TaxID=3469 RepID=UPI000E70342F|nr:uncharacterized protein LOC113360849 [Papaver somniferum]